jgi:uncharacterized Zn-binding protein involved in type VI secretion
MSIPVHRNGDSRNCGATTIVEGQGNVFVNGVLASVKGDADSHGAGALLADTNDGTVFINGIPVVLNGSAAEPDKTWLNSSRKRRPARILHKNPFATTASPNVFAC